MQILMIYVLNKFY